MKSMNVRRIAAVAAGAAMLGAAFAAAAVDASLGSYPFFNNFEPNVKIVVGANAAPSDAIAAGNIAAMIGSLAYVNEEIPVEGKHALSCGAGIGGGTCTVSDKKVSLEVTVPSVTGTIAGVTYQLPKVYIGGYLDSTTTDRTDQAPAGTALSTGGKSVTKDDTTLVFRGQVIDPTAAKTYTEEEKYYFAADVAYSENDDKMVASNVGAAYEITFTDAIPYCPSNLSAVTSTACGVGKSTIDHLVKIKFLGEDWIITDMSPGAKSITLGKEEPNSPVTLKIGETATTAGGAKITLKNLMASYTSGMYPAAILEIRKPDGTVACPVAGNPCVLYGTGSTAETEVDLGGGNTVVVKAVQIATGIGEDNYAMLSFYSKKLTLTNGQAVDSSDNLNWVATVDTSDRNGDTTHESVSRIYLYNTQLVEGNKLMPGQQITILAKPVAMNLTYDGLDKTDVTYDTLTIGSVGLNSYDVGVGSTQTAKTYCVSSSTKDTAFTIGSTSVKSFCAVYDAASVDGTAYGATRVYYKTSGASYWTNSSESTVVYNIENDRTVTLTLVRGNSSASGQPPGRLLIPEYVDTTGTANYNVTTVTVNTTGTYADKFLVTDQNKLNYSGTLREQGYITWRGVEYTSISDTGITLRYPYKVVQASFTMKKPSVQVTESGATKYELKEGETQAIGNGYSVKVGAITASTTGGAGSCQLTGVDSLRAYGVVVNERFDTASRPLVITDVEAGGVDQAIIVGGPFVNSLARALQNEADVVRITTTPGQYVVKVFGNHVLVAGHTAADTRAAANELIKWLKENRDSISR